jgi:superfamily I DNA and/or RNA helicase
LALVSRLLRQGFPSVMLNNQHRMREALIEIPNKFVYKTNPLQYVLGPLGQADTERFHDLLRKWLGVRLGAKTEGKDMSVVFLEASHGKSVCIKERNTTNSKRNHRNVDVVYDLIVRNHRAKAMNVNDIKIVTQYKDQARLYGLEYDNRAKESGIQGRCLPQVVTLDTLRGHEAKVIIYDLVVTCGDKEHGLGIVNNELRACIAATRASDTLIIVGSRELVTTFPDFWSWMNRRTGASDNPLPLIVRYAKALRNAGLSFEPPTEKREACPFGLKKEWFSKETGFMPWEWTRNNTSGERE